MRRSTEDQWMGGSSLPRRGGAIVLAVCMAISGGAAFAQDLPPGQVSVVRDASGRWWKCESRDAGRAVCGRIEVRPDTRPDTRVIGPPSQGNTARGRSPRATSLL